MPGVPPGQLPGGEGQSREQALTQLAAISFFFVTYGLVLADYLDTGWLGYILLPFAVYLAFGILGGLAVALRRIPYLGSLFAFLLFSAVIVLWPATLVWQVREQGWRSALITHGIPLAIALVLLFPRLRKSWLVHQSRRIRGSRFYVFFASFLPSLLRGLRMRHLIKGMAGFLVLVLGAILLSLFQEELWKISATIEADAAFPLLPLLAFPIALFVGVATRLSRAVPGAFEDVANEWGQLSTAATNDEDDPRKRALRVLFEISGKSAFIWKPEGRPPKPPPGLQRLRRPRRQLECVPSVERIMRDAFEDPHLERNVEWIRERTRWLFRRRITIRLFVASAALLILGTGVIWFLEWLLIDPEVASGWLTPASADVSTAVDVAHAGTWHYLRPALLLGGAALTLFFLWILVDDEKRQSVEATLIDDPVRRCLLASLPYYFLPTNDTFAGAHVITGSAGRVRGDNCLERNGGKERREGSHARNVGGHSVWYRWRAPETDYFTFTTEGSRFDTLLAVYRGDGLGALVEVAQNDDVRSGVEWSAVGFPAKEGAEYLIAVDGYCPLRQAQSRAGQLLATNDAFGSAERLSGETGSVWGTIASASLEDGEPDHAVDESGESVASGTSVWYVWQAPASQDVTFTTVGGKFEGVIAVYCGPSVRSLEEMASNRAGHVSFPAQKNVEYRIAVDGYQGARATEFELRWGPAARDGELFLSWQRGAPAGGTGTLAATHPTGVGPNDDFNRAHVLSGSGGRIRGVNTGATKESGEPEHAGSRGGASIWYRWQAPADGEITFATEGSDFDTLLAVYTGTTIHELVPIASNDDADGRWSSVTFDAVEAEVYSIAVDGYDGQSGSVVLSWWSPPPNDEFENAQALDGSSGRVRGTTIGAATHPGAPALVSGAGGADVWYRWQAETAGEVTFTTEGSTFDTVLAVYLGSILEELVLVGSNDDTPSGGRWSSVSFQAQSGAVYSIAVDGYGGATGDVVLNWYVDRPPGNDAFADAASLEGASGRVQGTTHSATREREEPAHAGNAGGTASVWYRWTAPQSGDVTFTTEGSSFDALVAVYTGSTLRDLAPVASNEASAGHERAAGVRFTTKAGLEYKIAVAGVKGAEGMLVLSWGFPPRNDAFAEALRLEGRTRRVQSTTLGASKEYGEPDHFGDAGGASVWYRWEAPAGGQATFTTEGSDFDTLLAVYVGDSLHDLAHVASNDDMDGTVTWSSVTFDAVAHDEYRIVVDGFRGAQGALALEWLLVERRPNIYFDEAELLHGPRDRVRGTNQEAEREPGEPYHADNAGGASVWYRWQAPESRAVTFTTEGSTFDTLLAVYTGTTLDDLVLVASNDDAIGGRWSSVTFRAVAGQEYSIAVDGFAGARGDIVLSWELAEPPPNDDFERAEMLEHAAGAISGTNVGATAEDREPEHGERAPVASVWYRWKAPADGPATFTTQGSSFDTLLDVYTGSSISELVPVASNDDAYAGATWSAVTFPAAEGEIYAIAIDGFGGASGDVELSWTLVELPSNDSFDHAATIRGAHDSTQTATLGATKEIGEPEHAGNAGGASVWYRWIAPADGRVTFSTEGSNFDTLLAAYAGASITELQPIASNDDFAGNTWSSVTFDVRKRTELRIAVDGYGGAAGNAQLTWHFEAEPDSRASTPLDDGSDTATKGEPDE